MALMDRTTNSVEIAENLVIRDVLASTRKSFFYTQFGREDEFKKREGNTIKWFTRSKLTAQTAVITDKPTLKNSAITHTAITAELKLYGNDSSFVEALESTSVVDLPGGVKEEIAYNAGESIDTIVRDTLLAAEATSEITHVFANGKTSGNITTADVAKLADFEEIATTLEENSVPRFRHPKTGLGVYIAIITPKQKLALMRDTTFKQMVQYGVQNRYWYGEVGIVDNIAFVVTDNTTTYTYNTDVACQKALVFGQDLYGVAAMPKITGQDDNTPVGTISFADNAQWTTDMVNKMFKVVITPPGGHGDEYAVTTTVAWKAFFAHKILQKDRGRVYVTANKIVNA